jgi:hypothetical protein
MAKYLRYEKAKASKVYMEIVEQAEQRLLDHGVFNKEEVVARCGYTEISHDLRWDYIRRTIEDGHNTELIPLAPAYFRRHSKELEKSFTEKFVAKGNGRGTVGYAIASEQNGHFIIHRLKSKMKLAHSFGESAERTKAIGIRVGAIPSSAPLQQIEQSKDAE